MSESIVPEFTDFDLTQPPGCLDAWARKIVTRHLTAVTWGRMIVVDDDDMTVFGGSEAGDQPEVTLEILHSRFYSAVVFGGRRYVFCMR